MNKSFLVVFMLLILVGTSVYAESYGDSNSSRQVLIVKEDTGYKKRLIKELISRLEDEGNIYITVVDHRKGELVDLDPADYNAVFITNSGVQAKVRPGVMTWLDKISGKDENVILHTTQTSVWEPAVEVDSITSASRNSNINKISDEIIQKIRVFL